jgi:hypothetical protein
MDAGCSKRFTGLIWAGSPTRPRQIAPWPAWRYLAEIDGAGEPVQRPADDARQCRDCRHQVEPDPAAMAERYGAEMPVPDWHKRLVCGQCGSRRVDFVCTGERRNGVA